MRRELRPLLDIVRREDPALALAPGVVRVRLARVVESTKFEEDAGRVRFSSCRAGVAVRLEDAEGRFWLLLSFGAPVAEREEALPRLLVYCGDSLLERRHRGRDEWWLVQDHLSSLQVARREGADATIIRVDALEGVGRLGVLRVELCCHLQLMLSCSPVVSGMPLSSQCYALRLITDAANTPYSYGLPKLASNSGRKGEPS